MDLEQKFKAVQESIARGDMDSASTQVYQIVSGHSTDPYIFLKCASLLKVIEDDEGSESLLDKVSSVLPLDASERMSIATALRGMGRAEDAWNIMQEIETTSEAQLMEKSLTLQSCGKHDLALLQLELLSDSSEKKGLLKAEILASMGDPESAIITLEEVISHYGASYDALVKKSNLLIKSGKVKEAIKFANSQLKEDKKSADMLALKAYVMRINGKTLAAVNYAHRALKLDVTHTGALETMAYCLIEKGKKNEAKMMAGAIYQKDPGNSATFQILQACMD